MDPTTLAFLAFGLVLLVLGAEWLVRGASRLAALLGVPPLVVGLTVVAFGTSAPELAVGTAAAWRGEVDLAVGNVIGSNIFNVLCVLGLAAVITPLRVARSLVRVEVPVMIAASLLLVALAADGRISRLDGGLLMALLVLQTSTTVWRARQERAADPTPGEVPSGPRGIYANLGLVAVGLGLLVLGSRWLVQGAVAIATSLGVSELVIGLTVLAVGTSLPEVAATVVAAIRGERDMAVGGVVGSNLFNILGVLGLAGAVSPAGLTVAPEAFAFDLPILVAAAVACLPVCFTGWTIHRWEGWFFLAGYATYTTLLILASLGHPEIETFQWALFVFVLPLAAVTLGIAAWRARGQAQPVS